MTELMKRYEAETDEIATWSWHNKEFVTDDVLDWAWEKIQKLQMEKTEMKTDGIVLTLDEAIKHCKENVQKETQNGNLQCAIEHNQLAIWLSQLEESKSKAAAYDRLMGGGKKTLKEIANFLGNPVAVDREGRLLWFPRKPEIGLTTWIWYDKYLPKNIFDYTGDWKDSLTLPDGWEEKCSHSI